jgi:two-component system, OmpR family, sensor kinase
MNGARLRSLRNKLALLFFGIVALAFGLVFFLVVPQLRNSLEDQQLDDLERAARATSDQLERAQERAIPAADLDELVRAVADAAGAQVTLLGVQVGTDVLFYPISDSQAQRLEELPDEGAAEAFESRRPVRVVTDFAGVDSAQIARPLPGLRPWIAVYSRSLDDVTETVGLIRRRVLVAGAGALFIALLGGYLIAGRLARRVQRLEAAAQAVASGRFVAPLPVDSEDELGQLTRTFNEMQHQLRQVDVARKEFVATASHELRTPIFSLGGFVELLRDEELDDETRREFLDTMAEQVERLQKLAVDLLDLSRLDAGSVALERESVDLSELARAVLGEFKPALQSHATEPDLRLPARISASCDRERVAQIMRILLDNALRHTPEGTRVTVSSSRANGAARVTVADEGPGVPDERQVFDRFYTGDATRGAGLGLAIARELAERMDGNLRVDGRQRGSAFTLELPAARR